MLHAAADDCEPVYVRFPDGDDVQTHLLRSSSDRVAKKARGRRGHQRDRRCSPASPAFAPRREPQRTTKKSLASGDVDTGLNGTARSRDCMEKVNAPHHTETSADGSPFRLSIPTFRMLKCHLL
jgi:hypothetical protein